MRIEIRIYLIPKQVPPQYFFIFCKNIEEEYLNVTQYSILNTIFRDFKNIITQNFILKINKQ
jgi:hypothetical protein